MALKDFIFGGGGGFGSDNPEFRNQAEYSGLLERIGLLAQENPDALKQYFSSPAGKQELQALGFSNVDELVNYASSAAPNVVGSRDYQSLGQQYGDQMNQIIGGLGGLSGDLTDYGSDFEYTQDDISNIPDEVWANIQEGQEEQAARGFKGAINALGRQYSGRGFRSGSGFEQSGGTALGRTYQENLRNISRDIGGQKAASKLDVAKFMSQQNLQRQGMQDASKQARANYLTQLQQYAKNFGSQNLLNQATIANQRFGGLGSAYEAQSSAAMRPYELGQQYYGMTQQNQGPEKSKGVFGDVLNAGSQVASAFI
ncbi:MAG: hypothetical protein SFW66_08895 [Gammaproteobacteria bacterium]|nr:hypothetical protein [Gammaproteobacteria bacterium]